MDSEPTDGRRFLLTVVWAAWLMTFGYAFVAFATAPFEADGSPAGMNKLVVFLGWQGIAGIVSVALLGVGLGWPRGSGVRRLSRLPFWLALLQGTLVLGFVFGSGA